MTRKTQLFHANTIARDYMTIQFKFIISTIITTINHGSDYAKNNFSHEKQIQDAYLAIIFTLFCECYWVFQLVIGALATTQIMQGNITQVKARVI